MMKIRKPDNAFSLKLDRDSFFEVWLRLIQPFSRLTQAENNVLCSLIKHHFLLKEKGNEDPFPELISKGYRKSLLEESGLTSGSYSNILTELRKKGIVTQSEINPKYMPRLSGEDYSLMVYVRLEGKDS